MTAVDGLALWALVLGAGFAAAGLAVVVRDRSSLPGRLALLAAGALMAAGPVAAAGRPRAAETLVVLAAAVAAPLALLCVVPLHGRHPAVPGLQLVVAAAGLTAVTGTALDRPAPGWSGGLTSAALTFCTGWVLFDRTTGDERRQVLWVILGVCTAAPIAALLLIASATGPFGDIGIVLLTAGISLLVPASLAVALIAPRAVDVRTVIREAVVLGVMALLVVAVWSGAETLLRLGRGTDGAPGPRALLALVVAAGFHPVAVRVRALADELLFGGRADPVDALTRLGTHLTAGSSPQEWLDTLRTALAVPGIELRAGGEVVATSGAVAEARADVTPLTIGGDHVGDLVVALPHDRLRLTPTTRAVAGLVAPPLAQALHAARLGEEVRASRQRVVTALEEERRRVRRDLHDGLGPTLTGIAYSADAAANLAQADPDAAVRLLRDLRADAGEAIAEVRRIVYGLRPRALDELGLVGAVRQQVQNLHGTGGRVVAVSVDAPGELPELAAAVEVAAYRVAVEAVTNVARHAGVEAAEVTFALPDPAHLLVRVADAGVSDGAWRHGVGLAAMRERVEGVGGVLTVEGGPDGAVVTAVLPIGENGV